MHCICCFCYSKTKINQNETVKQEVIKSIKKEKLPVPKYVFSIDIHTCSVRIISFVSTLSFHSRDFLRFFSDKIKVEKPKSVIDEIIETHAPSQTSKNKKKGKRQPQSGGTKSVQNSGKK